MSSPVGARPAPLRHVPRATYRLQFNRDFTFRQAADMADYLSDLGVSDVYASPLFKAGPQSTHGYDVCGFEQLNPGLGGEEEFAAFSRRLRDRKLGLLLDMVPNHMGADLANGWWLDVLEKGRASSYARWFDIDWDPPTPGLEGKVLLPVLEDHYGRVLEAGKLRLTFAGGALAVAYYDRRFPLAPQTYAAVLGRLLERGPNARNLRWFSGLKALLESLGAGGAASAAEFAKLKDQLRGWHSASATFRAAMDRALEGFNGGAGNPRCFDALDTLIRRQHYRLAWWRVGSREINYRRFFDVTELVSLRMELPEVFQATHRLVFQWMRAGQVSGLRIDHPDGLWDPKQYCQRLQERAPETFVVVEKILTGDERLRGDWPVQGTTGYDFLNRVNGLFVDSSHRKEFDRLYQDFTGRDIDFDGLVARCKRRMLESSFASDLETRARRLREIALSSRFGVELTLHQIRETLAEVITAFPVYRTYARAAEKSISAQDRQVVRQAFEIAGSRNPSLDPELLRFCRALLQLSFPPGLDEAARGTAGDFVMKFQQLTGPVMAKGVEDTAFYRFNRLISLNEVGGDPAEFGNTVEQFHAHNRAKVREWPHSLLATATHDTKRGEDARARINVLSEFPDEWGAAVGRWAALNAGKKSAVSGAAAPVPNDEYLLYQALVGAWTPGTRQPGRLKLFRERFSAYFIKALKEGKEHTSWTEPNSAYEDAARRFIEQVLADSSANEFLDDFEAFQAQISFFGRFNSLSQTLLKLASPGVPDFYQGSELWDLNLVDPDNRRPVDYSMRRRLLARMKRQLASGAAALRRLLRRLLAESESGESKLYVIWRALQFRSAQTELFEHGEYLPLMAKGSRRHHVCAFARKHGPEAVLAVAPRLLAGLAEGRPLPPLGDEIWGDTTLELPQALSRGPWRNVLTGERLAGGRSLSLGSVLRVFPVALLQAQLRSR